MRAAPIVVDRVSRAFGRRLVLREVSLEVRPGEILGLAGENGAGKSTLVRIVVGLLRPAQGRVLVRGRLGYCDQEPQLFPDLTVAEHFAFFARAYALPAPLWTANRDALLDRFAFTRHAGARVTSLSGGTRQKLHLALAVLHDPDVLILDEPCLAFDWETYLRFWAWAESLRSAGRTMVIVSHVAHDRGRFDRVVELREGVLTCA
jgi:ABC-2 type transport system ATP-binding protein